MQHTSLRGRLFVLRKAFRTSISVTGRKILDKLHVAALAICILGLSNTWLWPRPNPYPVPYRTVFLPSYAHAPTLMMGLWVTIAVTGLGLFLRRQYKALRSLRWWFPLALWSAVCLVFSDHAIESAWYIAAWSAIAIAGTALGERLRGNALPQTIAITFGVLLAATIPVGLFWPSLGHEAPFPYTFNGVFVQKQVLGWIACVAVLHGVPHIRSEDASLHKVTVAIAAISLVVSNSQSAILVTCSAVFLYWYLIPKRLPITSSFAAPAVIVLAAALLLIVPVNTTSELAAAVGRKDQLLGRILAAWPPYLRLVQGHEWLGLGPGAFASARVGFTVLPELPGNWLPATHSIYVSAIGGIGYPGALLLFLTLLVLAFVPTLKSLATPAVVAASLAFQLLIMGAVEPTAGLFPTQISLSVLLITAYLTRMDVARSAISPSHSSG